MHASGIGRWFRHLGIHGGRKMHVIAFIVYGILAGCLTALVGYIALRLCGMPRPPVGLDAYSSPSMSELRRADAR